MKETLKNGRELQYESQKRYFKTEKGKLAKAKANAKTNCKRFILEFAELKDLNQVQEWLDAKRDQLTK